MKNLIVALLAVAPIAAFADGYDNFPSYYPPTNGAAASCTEGQTEMFIEYNAANDTQERVFRTCHNGQFVESPAPVTGGSCVEGAKQMFIVYNASNDSQERVLMTCRNGEWQ